MCFAKSWDPNRIKVKIYIHPTAKPVFCKVRSVLYAMTQIGGGIGAVGEARYLDPVQFAEWAASIMPVLKSEILSKHMCRFQNHHVQSL